MLTVLAPAPHTALTTLDRVRGLVGFSGATDMQVTALIGQASQVIASHCRRTFGIETVREDVFDSALAGFGPLLERSPVIELLSVTLNGQVEPIDSFGVDPRTNRLLRLSADGRPMEWCGGSLRVTYRAGYVLPPAAEASPAEVVTLPESVERAAMALLSMYLSLREDDPRVKDYSVEGIGSRSYWVPGTADRLVSPEAAQLLETHVKFYP